MPAITREQIIEVFAPLAPYFRAAVIAARNSCDVDAIAAVTPHIPRLAHLRRLAGTERWMVIADHLVLSSSAWPEGYGTLSTESDHNRSRYGFQFPLGAFTIKREPHEPDQGAFIQQRLDGIAEQAQLDPSIDAFAGVLAYLSVPPAGAVQIIATHPSLEAPIVVQLDELTGGGAQPAAPIRPIRSGPSPSTMVRSTRDREADDVDADKDS